MCRSGADNFILFGRIGLALKRFQSSPACGGGCCRPDIDGIIRKEEHTTQRKPLPPARFPAGRAGWRSRSGGGRRRSRRRCAPARVRSSGGELPGVGGLRRTWPAPEWPPSGLGGRWCCPLRRATEHHVERGLSIGPPGAATHPTVTCLRWPVAPAALPRRYRSAQQLTDSAELRLTYPSNMSR